jgi:uncharacterized protein YbjQ (UPF0145 family)
MTDGPTGWDGQGLPPGAQARIARARSGGIRTSLSSIAGMAALSSEGLAAAAFDPVGEVMGGIVEHIGFAGWGGCGMSYGGFGLSGGGYAGPTRTSGGSGGLSGYAPYVDALYRGWDTALHRMLLEAQALGADGVVGVRWSWERLDETGNREFTALGTAVRSRSPVRPARLFATDLPATDVAKLLAAGHAPTGLVVGISVAIRHDDWTTRRQTSSFSAWNTEVTGYTELVTATRNDAREQFHRRAAHHGGDVAVVSGMRLNIWGIEPSDGHRDHVAEATVVGTALASAADAHHPAATPRPLTMLALR